MKILKVHFIIFLYIGYYYLYIWLNIILILLLFIYYIKIYSIQNMYSFVVGMILKILIEIDELFK